ncbi:unnamed protein product, partial [Meganyctiphanes norvegica]
TDLSAGTRCTSLLRPIVSATPQVTIQPASSVQSQPLDLANKHSASSKISLNSPSITQQIQIQPLPLATVTATTCSTTTTATFSFGSSMSPFSCSTTPSSALTLQPAPISSTKISPINCATTPSHFAVIPMDKLSSAPSVTQQTQSLLQNINPNINHQQPKIGTTTPAPTSTLPFKLPISAEPMVEKDGLVMINSNLALRIMSSVPSNESLEDNCSTIRSLSSNTNHLTILPQTEGTKLVSTLRREANKNPDILTIVPQVDISKQVSLLKSSMVERSSSDSSTIKMPKVTNAPSQVVKLYLLQPKDGKGPTVPPLHLNLPDLSSQKLNGGEGSFYNFDDKLRNDHVEINSSDNEDGEDDSEDDDDEAMVIDDAKEDGEEELMDPLSLCAVTMDDDNLELSHASLNETSSSSSVAAAGMSPSTAEKLMMKNISVKVKSNSNNVRQQDVDPEKYEQRKYVCQYCGRRFGWSTDLKRHVILHTGEKPFQCQVCPTAFTRKFLLQNHMKRMHPDQCVLAASFPLTSLPVNVGISNSQGELKILQATTEDFT